jgi:hypothetical protein
MSVYIPSDSESMSLTSSLVQCEKKTWLAGTQFLFGIGTVRSQSSGPRFFRDTYRTVYDKVCIS